MENTEMAEEIKENMHIDITDDGMHERIQDFVYEVNTGESGIAEFDTEHLTGSFEAFIIEPQAVITDLQVHFRGIKIYHAGEITRGRYIPIRTDPVNFDNETQNHRYDVKYVFNEPLRIRLESIKNNNIRIIIRMVK